MYVFCDSFDKNLKKDGSVYFGLLCLLHGYGVDIRDQNIRALRLFF